MREIVLKGGINEGKKQKVPCGECGICLQNNRNDWAIRLLEEQRVSLNSFFVTLTYREADLPVNDLGVPTLKKRELQLFFKRLRRRLELQNINDFNYEMATSYKSHQQKREAYHNLRFYSVGEYGTKYHRPHYHLLLFNIPLSILQTIDQDWQKGFVHCGDVNIRSIMYALTYHITRNPKANLMIDREPEFATMSRKPGIGFQFLEQRAEWNLRHENLYVIKDGFKMRLPRFWKEKLFNEDKRSQLTEQLLEDMKLREEKTHKELERLKYPGYDKDSPMTYTQRLAVQEAKRQYQKVVKGHKF